MTATRRHPRFRTRFDTLCSSGREEGAGVLCDISYAGARLEEASFRPEIGSKVTLYVFIQPVSPFQLQGTVVHRNDSGFAIEYLAESEEVRRLVDDVAAIVSVP